MHQIDYASKTLFRSSERCNAGPKIVWCIFRVHVKTGVFNFPQATVQPQVTYTVIILNLAFSCDYLVQYLFSSTPFFDCNVIVHFLCSTVYIIILMSFQIVVFGSKRLYHFRKVMVRR